VFAAVEPGSDADVVRVVARVDGDKAARHPQEKIGACGEIGRAVLFDFGDDAPQHGVSRRAASADDNQFGMFPGFVESDGEGSRGMAVVFDDVHRVPTVFVDIR
jgi:hypothetical protein